MEWRENGFSNSMLIGWHSVVNGGLVEKVNQKVRKKQTVSGWLRPAALSSRYIRLLRGVGGEGRNVRSGNLPFRTRVLYRSRQNDCLRVMLVLVYIDITPLHIPCQCIGEWANERYHIRGKRASSCVTLWVASSCVTA
ncbi:hypothetical protein TNCV_1030121 [Trichonephila clavipes]|nr:hypothetical protein TNCV_1030121 [Trichonephila clavipes]